MTKKKMTMGPAVLSIVFQKYFSQTRGLVQYYKNIIFLIYKICKILFKYKIPKFLRGFESSNIGQNVRKYVANIVESFL